MSKPDEDLDRPARSHGTGLILILSLICAIAAGAGICRIVFVNRNVVADKMAAHEERDQDVALMRGRYAKLCDIANDLEYQRTEVAIIDEQMVHLAASNQWKPSTRWSEDDQSKLVMLTVHRKKLADVYLRGVQDYDKVMGQVGYRFVREDDLPEGETKTLPKAIESLPECH